MAAFGDENIGRLDVAVDDALGMSGIESVRNLDRQTEQGLRVHSLSGDALFQRHAVHEFHGDERLTFVLTDLEDRADIWMVQRRRGLCLSLETGQRLWVSRYVVRKKLQGDKTVQAYVLGLVDDTHPAAAQLLDDAVMGNRPAGEWSRIGHWRGFYAPISDKSTKRGAAIGSNTIDLSCVLLLRRRDGIDCLDLQNGSGIMEWYAYIAYFFGGAFLVNAVPHSRAA